jgi:hypothetical protein
MKIRSLLGLSLVVALPACAPTIWEKPGVTPVEFSMDDARCQFVGEGANPDFGPPTLYTGSFKRDLAANAVAGLAHGIEQGLSVQHTHDLCMRANGYVARAPGSTPAPTLTVAAAPSAPVTLTASSLTPTTSPASAGLVVNPLSRASVPAGAEPDARVVLFPVTIYHSYHPSWTVEVQ